MNKEMADAVTYQMDSPRVDGAPNGGDTVELGSLQGTVRSQNWVWSMVFNRSGHNVAFGLASLVETIDGRALFHRKTVASIDRSTSSS